MTKKLLFTTSLSFYFLLAFTVNNTYAQVDLQCSGRDLHSIYLVDYSTGIFRIDSVDTAPTNPIFVTSNQAFEGISINNNLDLMNGQQTMYGVGLAHIYYYWNGTGWTNTGHGSGGTGTLNPGGSSDYIFNFDDNENDLYRYDGTGNSSLLLSNLSGNGCIHDVAIDNMGNFYLFFTNNQKIIAYNPSGIPIDTFTTSGFPIYANCGFTIIGSRLYGVTCGLPYRLFEGIKSGNSINFTMIKSLPDGYEDIASCSNVASPLVVFKNPDLPHFAVYPNPVRDAAVIKLYNTATIEIYNYMGILKEIISTRGLTEYRLDVSRWKTGVFFINAIAANKTTVRDKIVVQ